MNNNI